MTLVSQTFLASSKTIAAGTLTVALITPFAGIESATAATFSDVQFSHWARPFINSLAQNNIVSGYSDGTFRPDDIMTRTQFVALTNRALELKPVYESAEYQTQSISKMQALVMLSNRLELEPEGAISSTLSFYKDAIDIPMTAREGIAAATENQLVVNYPNTKLLMPYQDLTRAEAVAFIHQALVYQGQLEPISPMIASARYVVKSPYSSDRAPIAISEKTSKREAQQQDFVPKGTQIPLEYMGERDINLIITPDETYQASFVVSDPVVDRWGDVIIPKGSRIQGQFVPMKINGQNPATHFRARQVIMDGISYPIDAESDPQAAVAQSEVAPDDLELSIVSSAATRIIQSIEKKPSGFRQILADVFDLERPQAQDQSVILIDPNRLVLTTQSRFELASR